MTPKEAVEFVVRHGIVLQAARGPVPSLAETIAVGPIRGSWWGHPKGHEIFAATEAIGDCDDVLVCKVIEGKVTYIHRRLWPALVKLAARFQKGQLARVWNEHTPSGAHRMRRQVFPEWVPPEVEAEASALSEEKAEDLLAPLLPFARKASASDRAWRGSHIPRAIPAESRKSGRRTSAAARKGKK